MRNLLLAGICSIFATTAHAAGWWVPTTEGCRSLPVAALSMLHIQASTPTDPVLIQRLQQFDHFSESDIHWTRTTDGVVQGKLFSFDYKGMKVKMHVINSHAVCDQISSILQRLSRK